MNNGAELQQPMSQFVQEYLEPIGYALCYLASIERVKLEKEAGAR